MAGIRIHQGGAEEDPSAFAARTAIAVRSASRKVLGDWTEPQSSGDPGDVDERGIEAQIAAAAFGRKPLYYEEWGDEIAGKLAIAYRKILPPEVAVEARNGLLLIYRPEVVKPILDSDPGFYRRKGESDLDSIVRVSKLGENGELLGYGAKHWFVRPCYRVHIYRGESLLLYIFFSAPDEETAVQIANERTADFYHAFGWENLRFVMEFLP